MANWLEILGPFISLLNGLGVLPSARRMMVPDYQEAAEKLAEVLGELEKNYRAIDEELKRLADLSFNPTDTDEQARRKLDDLEPIQVSIRMEEARGHCSKIKNIYETYLKAKLRGLLLEEDARTRVENLFREMTDSDGQMMRVIQEMCNAFTGYIEQLKPLVVAREFGEANKLVRQAAEEMRPQRNTAKKAIVTLLRLRADYIEASGTV
jgi:hypothetical protein